MSDIYLQITETPTVVTLSAPVVSGALASTVTVANTVTVALDSNSLSALENVTVTVGAAITGTVTVSNFPATVTIGNTVTIAGTVTANPTGTQTIAGTVTANVGNIESIIGNNYQSLYNLLDDLAPNVTINGAPSTGGTQPISGTVTVGNSVTISSLPSLVAGTAQIGVVTIGNIRRAGDNAISQLSTEAGSNYLLTVVMPGTSQIGSVTASISNSLTISSLPVISGTVTANTFALQGTAVTTSNFTSTTASTVLAGYNATREVLSIFNEGAGLLFVCPGATCTTVQYQVRLSSGDYWEAPNHQTTITHSAVFQTAGTARVTEVS